MKLFFNRLSDDKDDVCVFDAASGALVARFRLAAAFDAFVAGLALVPGARLEDPAAGKFLVGEAE